MRIVHVGPATARLGGPAGYLHELRQAAEGQASRGHDVLFPPAARPAPPGAAARPPRALDLLRRLRSRLLGAPRQYRPPLGELRQAGGRIDASLRQLADQSWDECEASRELAGQADACFAHDPLVAERLLDAGLRVWLMVHAPFPLSLYHVWSFGVPELPWEEVAAFPDVRTWTSRELRIWQRVDRLVLPCREALDEVARVEPGFGGCAGRAEYLASGAAAAPGSALDRDAARRRFDLPAGVPVALFLGNRHPYRGLDALLASLPHLTRPGVVAVAGVPPDQLPASPRLRGLGRVGDVGALLAAVDAVVNVNRFTLFDLSTIEALEAGRPLLLHAIGGNLTFRDLGAGCVMVDDLEPASIARGLDELFALPAPELAALGRRSRDCYLLHLTPEALWQRHLDFYDGGARC